MSLRLKGANRLPSSSTYDYYITPAKKKEVARLPFSKLKIGNALKDIHNFIIACIIRKDNKKSTIPFPPKKKIAEHNKGVDKPPNIVFNLFRY